MLIAERYRIPAMYEYSTLVADGGLMSYGASQDENFRLAAGYVDRILKGAVPRALPVEQPERYYLTINLTSTLGRNRTGALINGARVVLTGQGVAPSLFAVMVNLGQGRTAGRLRHPIQIAPADVQAS